MTIPRVVGLLVGLTVLGIAVVAIRLDQARHVRMIQLLQVQEAELRQEIWSQEMDLARLRSPQMIRERAARFGVQTAIEPGKDSRGGLRSAGSPQAKPPKR